MLNVKSVDIKTKIDFRTITSSLDQIKMTENWLEFDRKFFTNDELYILNLNKIHNTDKLNFTPKNYVLKYRLKPFQIDSVVFFCHQLYQSVVITLLYWCSVSNRLYWVESR